MLADYLPPNVRERLTPKTAADFDASFRSVLLGTQKGPGADQLHRLFSHCLAGDLGDQQEALGRITEMGAVASPFLSVAAVYWAEAWESGTVDTWELPHDVELRLSGMTEPISLLYGADLKARLQDRASKGLPGWP